VIQDADGLKREEVGENYTTRSMKFVLFNVIRMANIRKRRWAGHVARIEEMHT
jgi:hypothetical protein